MISSSPLFLPSTPGMPDRQQPTDDSGADPEGFMALMAWALGTPVAVPAPEREVGAALGFSTGAPAMQTEPGAGAEPATSGSGSLASLLQVIAGAHFTRHAEESTAVGGDEDDGVAGETDATRTKTSGDRVWVQLGEQLDGAADAVERPAVTDDAANDVVTHPGTKLPEPAVDAANDVATHPGTKLADPAVDAERASLAASEVPVDHSVESGRGPTPAAPSLRVEAPQAPRGPASEDGSASPAADPAQIVDGASEPSTIDVPPPPAPARLDAAAADVSRGSRGDIAEVAPGGLAPGAGAPRGIDDTAPAPHSNTVQRLIDVIEQLENQPPPRRMTVEIGELRLSVALHGDTVRVAVIGASQGQLDADWARELATELEARGMELGDGGQDGRGDQSGRPKPEDRSFDQPSTQRRSVRTPSSTTTGLRL